MMRKLQCWLAGLVILLISVAAPADDTLAIHATTDHVRLTRSLYYYLDEQRQLSIDDILTGHYPFVANEDRTLNVGFTTASVWVRTHITYDGEAPKTWYLELSYPLLHKANLYLVRNGEVADSRLSGQNLSPSLRAYPSRNFVYPIRLLPGDSVTLYLNVERPGTSIRVPLQLWDDDAFEAHETRMNYLLGGYFGLLAAMMCYNLFLLVILRMPFQVMYLCALSCIGLMMLALTGYGRLLFWTDSPRLNDLFFIGGGGIIVFFGTEFGRKFVNVAIINTSLDRVLQTIAWLGLILSSVYFVTDIPAGQMTSLFIGSSSLILLSSAIYCWLKGSHSALYFVIGWGAMLVGVVAFSLMNLNLIPFNAFSEHGLMLGSAVEVVLLSLGIADFFNRQRQSHIEALESQHATLLKLKDTEQQLIHRALHSGTTGLPNRSLLREAMRQQIERDPEASRFALLLISFKNFHEFNKTLGHQNGDEILRLMARRLGERVRQHLLAVGIEQSGGHPVCIATVEGVTFGCLLNNASVEEAKEFGDELVRHLEQPFTFQDMSLNLSISVGISHHPFHGQTPDQLLRNCQIALELAGEDVEQVKTYDPEQDPYSARRLTLLSELRHAIHADALDLYLQPQMDLASQKITGAEVLIRWNHPSHGFVPPDQFIPIAERTGVIQPLTHWVFRRAFRYLDELNARGYNLTLSVNISARNLQDPSFQERALLAAREFRINPAQIVMELTETAILLNEERGNNTLYQLDNAGFGLAIDDFGTGYSSLSHLKRVPVREIKIDRSFIRDMHDRLDDQVIVATTLQMGHNLGLRVVAEGIEDATTLEFLRKAGCDMAQGYHIAKPMPFADFLRWIEERQPCERTAS